MPYDKPKSFIKSAGVSAGVATILMYCLSGSGKSLKFLKIDQKFGWRLFKSLRICVIRRNSQVS